MFLRATAKTNPYKRSVSRQGRRSKKTRRGWRCGSAGRVCVERSGGPGFHPSTPLIRCGPCLQLCYLRGEGWKFRSSKSSSGLVVSQRSEVGDTVLKRNKQKIRNKNKNPKSEETEETVGHRSHSGPYEETYRTFFSQSHS